MHDAPEHTRRARAILGANTLAADGDLTRRLRRGATPVIGSGAGVTSFLHVDDAATATERALEHGRPGGIYNVADDEPVTFRELLPVLAGMLGARRPVRLPGWLARPLAGASGVVVMTAQRGADSRLAAVELGWRPGWPSWRAGFAEEYRAPGT